MAIYLDANILWSWRTFVEPDRLAVSIVARQLGQDVFIPWVAAREAEETYRRSLEVALVELESAHAVVVRKFATDLELVLEPWPDVEAHVATWRRRLADVATILPLRDDHARAALEREICGAPPARPRERQKSGRGARDVAIWLTVARHHSGAGEEGHFLSADRTDFAGSDGELAPALRSDLEAASRTLNLHASVSAFVLRLGTVVAGHLVAVEDLRDRASGVLRQALRRSLEVPSAVWDELMPTLRYGTEIVTALPVEILEQRRYQQGKEAIIVVNARWAFSANCLYQERDTATPNTWTSIEQIDVAGKVQIFLEERGGELRQAHFIGAQLASDTQLYFSTEGSVVSIGSARALE